MLSNTFELHFGPIENFDCFICINILFFPNESAFGLQVIMSVFDSHNHFYSLVCYFRLKYNRSILGGV